MKKEVSLVVRITPGQNKKNGKENVEKNMFQ